jgi:lysophospholipase L1-like esterase
MKPCAIRRFVLLLTLAGLVITASPAGAEEPNDFARWETAIAAFEKKDREQPPPKESVLFVGSSSIRLWSLAEFFPGQEFINRGFGGSEIADSNHFADRIILKHQPRTVVLYAGDNDIAKGKTATRVAADFRTFVQTVRAKLPKANVLFIAIKPSIKRWNLSETMQAANREIQSICDDDDRLSYIDIWKPMLGDDGRPRAELFAKDGLHLNSDGYKLWTAVLGPHLEKSRKP